MMMLADLGNILTGFDIFGQFYQVLIQLILAGVGIILALCAAVALVCGATAGAGAVALSSAFKKRESNKDQSPNCIGCGDLKPSSELFCYSCRSDLEQ